MREIIPVQHCVIMRMCFRMSHNRKLHTTTAIKRLME